MTLPRHAEATAVAAPPGTEARREFEFSDADFRKLAEFAYRHTGISLSTSKRDLVYNRLSRRLRALGLTTFREYHEYLEGPQGDQETERFINSVSTNHTRFFREPHHFDHFRSHVAERYARTNHGPGGGRLRIWSAGCSTGEEPYTIALVLKKEIAAARHDVRILATDIDTDVLAKGQRGEYAVNALQEIPPEYRGFFQTRARTGGGEAIVADDSLRSLISFRQLNLIEQQWPMKGPFDAIFCRNVMIYFDNPTKKDLVERLTRLVRPGGWLYIGHSESLIGAHPGLELVGRTIYRRES